MKTQNKGEKISHVRVLCFASSPVAPPLPLPASSPIYCGHLDFFSLPHSPSFPDSRSPTSPFTIFSSISYALWVGGGGGGDGVRRKGMAVDCEECLGRMCLVWRAM